jgi:hypothetical protein
MKALTSIVIIISLAFLGACKKTNNTLGNDPGGSDTTYAPAITAVGDKAGTPVSGSIGAGGGTLTSSDGRIQLVIPPGALSQTTSITIQPVTNLCPGGIGLAYDLQPEGTKFSIPAYLKFNYADSDVDGTSPLLISSVFQDSASAWEFDDGDKDVDSVNKVLSFNISHFSTHGFVPRLRLFTKPKALQENETSIAKVQVWFFPADNNSTAKPYVRRNADVNSSLISNWQLSDETGGKLSPNGNTAVYKAASKVTRSGFAFISCDVKTHVQVALTRGRTYSEEDIHIQSFVYVSSGVLSFNVKFQVIMHHTSFFIADRYIDGATMQVDAKYGDVTISKVQNQVPSADPSTDTYGDATVTFSADQIGVTDIDESKTTGKFDGKGNIIITVAHKSDTFYPLWNIKDNHDAGHATQGGYLTAGVPTEFTFPITDKTQTVVSSLVLDPDSLVVTATPRN